VTSRTPYPENVLGDFYVEDGCCTMCTIPFTAAPGLFGTSIDESHCFVKSQPSSDDDLTKMVNAIGCAELQCIRYKGSNRTIQIRLIQMNEGATCDALPPDLAKLSEQMERQAAARRVALRKAQHSWWHRFLQFFRASA